MPVPASALFSSLLVDSVAVEEQERERRRQVVEKFQKAPFEEIAAHCGARVSDGFSHWLPLPIPLAPCQYCLHCPASGRIGVESLAQEEGRPNWCTEDLVCDCKVTASRCRRGCCYHRHFQRYYIVSSNSDCSSVHRTAQC